MSNDNDCVTVGTLTVCALSRIQRARRVLRDRASRECHTRSLPSGYRCYRVCCEEGWVVESMLSAYREKCERLEVEREALRRENHVLRRRLAAIAAAALSVIPMTVTDDRPVEVEHDPPGFVVGEVGVSQDGAFGVAGA